MHEAERGEWSEAAGILAFSSWYPIQESRCQETDAIVGQSDDLAVGAREASRAAATPEHARMFAKAKLFGIGCCAGYGRELVDDGTLQASVVVQPATVTAIELLRKSWADGRTIRPRSFAEVVPYPPGSAAAA